MQLSKQALSGVHYDVPLVTFYNTTRHPIQLIVRETTRDKSSVDSDVPYNISSLVTIYPNQRLRIEPDRIDAAQQERYAQLFQIYHTNVQPSESIDYKISSDWQHGTTSFLRGIFLQLENLEPVGDSSFNISPARFGTSVTMTNDGNKLFVGAPGRAYNTGAVYMYDRDGDHYVQSGLFLAMDGTPDDNFGYSVTASSDASFFVATARHTDLNDGAAYIFFNSGGGYTQLQQIFEDNPTPNSRYGHIAKISPDGGTIFISAPDAIRNDRKVGAVYIYRYSFGTFIRTQLIYGDDLEYGQYLDFRFGDGMDYWPNGDILAVGAPGYGNGDGKVYLLKWDGSAYMPLATTIECKQADKRGIEYGSNISFGEDEIFITAPSYGDSQGLVEHYSISVNGDITYDVVESVLTVSDGTPLITDASETFGVYLLYNPVFFIGGPGDGIGTFVAHSAEADYHFVSGPDAGGVVYAYNAVSGEEENEVYAQIQTMRPYVVYPNDNFGNSAAASGNGVHVAIGAPGHTVDGQMNAGTVYIYTTN